MIIRKSLYFNFFRNSILIPRKNEQSCNELKLVLIGRTFYLCLYNRAFNEGFTKKNRLGVISPLIRYF